MTSAQTSERNIDQSNKQTNVQISEKTTAQLIKLLIAIIPNYDVDITLDEDDISAENFASVASLTELVLASSEHS